MKGKLILIPLKEPKVGIKVVFGSTKDTKDNPECVGIIENAQPQTEKYSDVKHGNFTTFVPHSYLNQIEVEYEKEESYTFTERGRDGVTETDIIKITLPLHPDDYETALPLIGKEIEFVEVTGTAFIEGTTYYKIQKFKEKYPIGSKKLITPTPVETLFGMNEEDTQRLIKLWSQPGVQEKLKEELAKKKSSPTPVMYTEEEVRVLVFQSAKRYYNNYLNRGIPFSKFSSDFPDWWNENKKK